MVKRCILKLISQHSEADIIWSISVVLLAELIKPDWHASRLD